ncbi:MAG TPA: secretin and TonB N-terminal domain-containing protein [Tepidisphaeraceae bacterium]|nr:secretin and TonB N-terminal domain-containing protein [Tepidisphaeraceae bacterium]
MPAPDSTTDVKVLEESDPFAAPATQPAAPAAGEGQSVSSSEVSVSDAGVVEIHVNDANLVEVLRMLSLQTQKNILPSKDVRGSVTANLYDVTVREALDAILHANGYAYREKGNFIYVYTTKELAEIEKAELRMQTRVFRVYYTPALNAQNMIKPVMSAAGQSVVTTPALSGIESGISGLGGNDHATDDMLVVTDYPENLDRVKMILDEIDKRPQQILLEAVICRAVLNEDNAFGIDFSVLGGVDFNGVNAVGSSPGDAVGGGIINNPDAGNVLDNGYGGGDTGFTNNVPNGGLRLGFVSNNIGVFLKALEQTTDTTILANPKILTLNKQKGEVFVGNEDGYKTTITTETTTSETVETLKTGTRLIFRPYIAADGYIRMEIHPEDSAGEVKANGLPSKSTTEITSNVMLKDGHTLVIGGLFRESSTANRSQVPFLGNIPLIGAAFRSTRDRTVREEVIVLLTPHIVKDEVTMHALSEEELKRIEQLRVGTRRGMMWFGRERLAESAFESAKREMTKDRPNRKTALWHLNCATNLNPKMIEAIEMKQELTGREVTTSDGSSVRSFVRRMMLEDVVPVTTTTRPTTRPRDVTISAAPATQPIAAAAPTTQPLVAEAPTTQPTVAEVTEELMQGYAEEVEGEFAAAPATQPAAESDSAVTELPIEEVEGQAFIELESK